MFWPYQHLVIKLTVEKCKCINLTLYFVNENGREVSPLCSYYIYCTKYCEQYCHVPQFMTCLTNSYFKACSYSASSEIAHVLWNPKVHCHVLSSQLLVPVLGQMSPVLTLTSCFFKILFNYFLPSMPRSVQVFSSCQVSPPKPSMHISSSPNVPHALPISSSAMLSQFLTYRHISYL